MISYEMSLVIKSLHNYSMGLKKVQYVYNHIHHIDFTLLITLKPQTCISYMQLRSRHLLKISKSNGPSEIV